MLKDLSIHNLVLMDCCKISFDEGLCVLTGETGSGKTAILESLKLLLGQKLDTSLIRFGEKKGFIQARFEVHSAACLKILQEASIDVEDGSLILTREVFSEGKSKNFINDRMVSLSLLQSVGAHLIQIVDQSSHQELKQTEKQRNLLDLFAGLEQEVTQFQAVFSKAKDLKLQMQELTALFQEKEREFDFCLAQQKELVSLSLQEGEEEALFQEYTNSFKAQEVTEKIDKIFNLLQNGKQSVLSGLFESFNLCQSICSLHDKFAECCDLLKQSSLLCKELLSILQQALSAFDVDPHALQKCENKLSLIEKMKKKYGPNISDWENYKNQLSKKIEKFENLEEHQKELQEKIQQTEESLCSLGTTLSEKRKQAAIIFSQKLKQELDSLNMEQSQVQILVEKQPRSSSGEDNVVFCLSAGVGETIASIKENASGGELSRLLLAIKLCLAEKNETKTLIFDEIDANVGGQTAKLIGEKLLALSSHRQVICITHFPQVASQATTHFCVQKQTKQERTISSALKLDQKGREQELIRMLGGKSSKQSSLT